MKTKWSNPSAEHRPAPFFILNDDHAARGGRRRIEELIRKLKHVGYGGLFLHPRPGLVTEYLSTDWFRMIEWCRAAAARSGMKVHLYDENTFPSGYAGGHVAARHPEARVQFVRFRILRTLPDQGSGDQILAGYRLRSERPVRVGRRLRDDELALWLQDQHVSVKRRALPRQPILVLALNPMAPLPWFGQLPYVSLVDPQVAPAFLEITHEAYRHRFGRRFGREILSMFTDEPNLATIHSGPFYDALPVSPYIFEQFRRRCGYDLRDHLSELFFDCGDWRRARFDYYETLHQLWLENWAKPLEAWCGKHRLPLTGHYLEHDWPCPYATPGHVHLLAHMHWPGTDMLFGNALDGETPPWFCCQERAQKGREPHFTMYLRQCLSVSNQLGKERVVCECWGAGGHDSTFEDYKRIGDWLVAHGVNLLIPHMSMATIRGSRKFDHPQFFSDQSSWFPYLKPLNDHFGRLCALMTRGRVENAFLVLDPLTTGYLLARKSEPWLTPFKALDSSFSELVQTLCDGQFDFDLGDEYVMEEFGRAAKGRLVVGRQSYATIVWPPRMRNVRTATVRVLEQFLRGGGTILGLEHGKVFVDGRPNPAIAALRRRYARQWQCVKNLGELLALLARLHPPSLRLVRSETRNPESACLAEASVRRRGTRHSLPGLAHHRRILPDGLRLHLLVNSTDRPLRLKAMTRGHSIRRLDTLTGRESVVPCQRQANGHIEFEFEIGPTESRVFMASDRPERKASTAVGTVRPKEVVLEVGAIRRVEPNRLVLDHCDLQLPGRKPIRNLRVHFASQRIWQAHGFADNAWFRAIQYRRQIIDHPVFGPGSGFGMTFRFEVGAGVDPASLQLGMECPELYAVRANGRSVHFDSRHTWLDPHIRLAPLRGMVRPGWNTLTVEGRPFDVRMEPDHLYLLGDFALEPATAGFRIIPPRELRLGSWKNQGLPFYDTAVDYVVRVPARFVSRAILRVTEWEGSLIEVRHRERAIGQIAWPPYELDITTAVAPGRSTDLVLRVVGKPKNLLGPFHDPNRMRRITGQYLNGDPHGPVPGRQYDLLDYGLLRGPVSISLT